MILQQNSQQTYYFSTDSDTQKAARSVQPLLTAMINMTTKLVIRIECFCKSSGKKPCSKSSIPYSLRFFLFLFFSASNFLAYFSFLIFLCYLNTFSTFVSICFQINSSSNVSSVSASSKSWSFFFFSDFECLSVSFG